MARHHYVPRFLLNKWLNHKKELYYYSNRWSRGEGYKENRKWSTRNIFCKEELYAEYESKHFIAIDNDAGRIINSILSRNKFDDYVVSIDELLREKSRAKMVNFISSLMRRHPVTLDKAEKSKNEISKGLMQEKNPYKELFDKSGHLEAVAMGCGYESELLSLALNDPLPALTNSNWYFFNFNESKYKLIISDKPISLIFLEENESKNTRTINELLMKNTCLYFPISPSVGFLSSPIKPTIGRIKEVAKYLNCLQLNNSPTELCSSEKIAGFINKYMPK